MKNNILKNKAKNCKYNFSKNLLYHFIVPCVAIIIGIVLMCTVGFNYGLDFNGGINAIVVVQDIKTDNNFDKAQKTISEILDKHNVSGEVYQLVETNYYGDAISVKFEAPVDDKYQINQLVVLLEQELTAQFYPELNDKTELANLLHVDTFKGSVSSAVLLSSLLAVIIAIVGGFVYLSARYGIAAGMTSLCVAFIDIVAMLSWTLISRVNVESTLIISAAFTVMYSFIASTILFARNKENLSKEKYSKLNNKEIANQSVKDVMFKNTVFALFLLVATLLLGVIPTYMVRRMSIPMMLGCFCVYYSSMLITPGLWAYTHIRKVKKQKEDKEQKQEVIVEEHLTQEDIENAPEVIVETEAKE